MNGAIERAPKRTKAQDRAERAESREVAALERERNAQAAAARERKEAQARRVVAWISSREAQTPEDKETYQVLALMGMIPVLLVLNGSDAPVFKVSVFNMPDDGNLDPLYTVNVLPPGTTSVDLRHAGHLEKGEIIAQFKDIAGQWWLRGHDGHLEETTSNKLWDS